MATPLEVQETPICFEATDSGALRQPAVRLGQAQRTRVRSLSGMQKEALVTSTLSGDTWRLASDEGPYLDGADVAPPPLAFLATGVASSYVTELLALAEQRDVAIEDVELTLDNYYAISGSALAGTMTGTALTPEVTAALESDADAETLSDLVETATTVSPINGLLTESLSSRFTLTREGRELSTDRVVELDDPPSEDPIDAFEAVGPPGGAPDEPIIEHTGRTTEEFPDGDETYTDKDAEGYSEEQDRMIHVRATCTVRDDGLKHVEQKLYSPRGSIFRFLSDEPEGHGGRGRAPDAASYIAAGIGFCFMTQLGRYAEVVGEELSAYRLVQDTHVSLGGASAGTGQPGAAEPVDSNLFVDGPFDDEFARELLDMSEQTCYLHALCRTSDVAPDVEIR